MRADGLDPVAKTSQARPGLQADSADTVIGDPDTS